MRKKKKILLFILFIVLVVIIAVGISFINYKRGNQLDSIGMVGLNISDIQ